MPPMPACFSSCPPAGLVCRPLYSFQTRNCLRSFGVRQRASAATDLRGFSRIAFFLMSFIWRAGGWPLSLVLDFSVFDTDMAIQRVGVIGAGTMGNGIAHVFARSGFNVLLCDVEQRFVDRGLATIGKNCE